jgi:DAACS family dicarboxylate/amino acid:cation (Na+ or H+) symporter
MAESIGNTGKGMKLHTKILLGLLTGAVLGILAYTTLRNTHPAVVWVNRYVAYPVGQVFYRSLYMIVMPLVFASIALGVAGLGDLRRAGRVGGKAVGYFLVTTALAATVGLLLVHAIRPGTGITEETRGRLMEQFASQAASSVEASGKQNFGVETVVSIVTRNPIKSAVDNDMLGVIFFALVFGVALTMIARERARPLLAGLEGLNDVVIKIVELVMKFAPFGVAALIFGVTSNFGFDLLRSVGTFVMTVLGALLLHTLVTLSLILLLVVRVSPVTFFSRIRSSIVTAFSTSSSSATLPTNLAVAEQNLGIPPQVAGFVLPLGSTMCMNGTAIFEGITVIFLCQVFGIALSLGDQIVVIIMAVLTAVGAAGVPGGSIPLLVGILTMFGVPGAAIGIVLGVDRILDMSRTTVNVIGDMSASAFVAKSEGLWDASRIPAVEGLDVTTERLDESPGWPAPAPDVAEPVAGKRE